MAIYPVRRLGAGGIIADAHPADLEDPAVFTAGVNVRFSNGRVSRGPVARTVATLDFAPGHALAIPPASGGYDEIVMVAADFSKVKRLNGSALQDLTPAGQLGAPGAQPITSCFLGGVSYINRESHAPIAKTPDAPGYTALPNWPAGCRCRVLRPYKDQLIALGVTKAGVFYPTMVKWSDLSLFGAPPPSWDPNDPTNSAGENIVNEMQHTLIDGLALRNSFVLYCTNSVWAMDFTAGTEVYQFTKLFDERGVISPNCVVQVGGQHFVFDRNDIYVHDGVAPVSIVSGKNRSFIFDALDTARSHLCFVTHDAKLSEVRFCYPSSDRLVGFVNPTTGCNRAAVYNYGNDTWTFYDLPNVTGACRSSIVSGKSWEDDQNVSWDDAAGLYLSTEGDESQHVLLVGRQDASQGLTASRLYGFDLVSGGLLSIPVEPEALRPALVERTGIDLDSAGKNLTQYVHVQAIWPQVSVERPGDSYWQFGGNGLVNAEPLWSDRMAHDPATEPRIDINEGGKYLAYRFAVGGQGDFKLSGFDIQLVTRGRR